MVPEDAPQPRLCSVKKWSDFSGYGFNLHAEKGKAGQYIGKVDDNSPAKLAGMKEGDRIVEVNGVNISNENHQQVVTRIKHDPNSASLLLVDTDTDNYYKENKIVIRGDMPNVLSITCPDTSDGQATEVSLHSSVEPDAGEAASQSSDQAESTPSTEHEYHPRRCQVKMWPDFQGYGFNLHAEKGKPGQFIGKVDEGSPAEAAGLREGDRILEVNGESLSQDSHQQVVQKIKSNPNETEMLVVDTDTDAYFKDKGVVVVGTMDCVQTIVCPDSKPLAPANGSAAEVEAEVNHQEHEEEAQVQDEDLNDYETPDAAPLTSEYNEAVIDEVNGEDEVAAALSQVDQAVEDEEKQKEEEAADDDDNYEQVVIADTPSPAEEPVDVPPAVAEPEEPVVVPAPLVMTQATPVSEEREEEREEPTTPVSPGPVTIGGIEFAGSIEEAKQRAGRKKKKDPRLTTQLSMKDKYDVFQKM